MEAMNTGRRVLEFERPITHAELNSLTTQKDQLVVMAICRALGTTDWEMDDEMYKRGRWVEYADGEQVFSLDGKELLLIMKPHFDKESNEWRQGYQWLFDINDFNYEPNEVFVDDEG